MNSFFMPAEWMEHRATWIAWPHESEDWPGKFEPITWVYCEIVRVLGQGEKIEILCNDSKILAHAKSSLELSSIPISFYNLHLCATDRSWLRDSAPTLVKNLAGAKKWLKWNFKAWAKYENYLVDQNVPGFVASFSKLPLELAIFKERLFSIEGGAIETDGAGTLLTTEECLLSKIQERNPGFKKSDYEKVFKEYLGITKVIWLGAGCAGDDTHGHIDDIARFTELGKILVAVEDNPHDENFSSSQANLKLLEGATDARDILLEIRKLPFPRAIFFDGQRLPASYANFYIANSVVAVPTFNDPNDLLALQIIQQSFPTRKVVGINCSDLILGLGTLHCLTQQEPI